MSTTLEVFKAIQSSHISHIIGSQDHLVGAFLQLIHIIGLLLILSSVLLVSLRLFGLGKEGLSIIELGHSTEKLIWIGLGLLTVSGLLIFAPAATNYYPNFAFWAKFILLAFAVTTHVTLYRWVTTTDTPNPVLARTAGAVSLLLWFAVAFAARFIGFV